MWPACEGEFHVRDVEVRGVKIFLNMGEIAAEVVAVFFCCGCSDLLLVQHHVAQDSYGQSVVFGDCSKFGSWRDFRCSNALSPCPISCDDQQDCADDFYDMCR